MSSRIPLSPTLWRTCRALANRRRLRALQYLMGQPNRTVKDVASALRWPEATASLYLRALNARGLLEAKRRGRHVSYSVKADPSIPHADPLLKALARTFDAASHPIDEAFAALTGFTHPRRIAIVRALGGDALPLRDVQKRTGINPYAALRHLRKLRRRGYVAKRRRFYRCVKPRDPLSSVLLDLARGSA